METLLSILATFGILFGLFFMLIKLSNRGKTDEQIAEEDRHW